MSEFTRDRVVNELHSIGRWWLDNTLDERDKGFIGEASFLGLPVANAGKSLVLNSRILWFFSELCLFEDRAEYRETADRAFQYLYSRFHDHDFGGAVWELDAHGDVKNNKKQTYALCFCVYAYCAYFKLSGDVRALNRALEYFDDIENHARDLAGEGYFEAFSHNWQAIDDVRLGVGDLNAPKSMNTHLHLLEAYTALHRVVQNKRTESALRNALQLICDRIVDRGSGHLRLFFDAQWSDLSTYWSYGHDIEASWLLWEAAAALDDDQIQAHVGGTCLLLASTCLSSGIGDIGQVCADFDFEHGYRQEHSVWWPQAEALIGFLNAHLLGGEDQYLHAATAVWQHIDKHHIDRRGGEWHWMTDETGKADNSHYKAGFWKGPYHNGRAMIESARILSELDHA